MNSQLHINVHLGCLFGRNANLRPVRSSGLAFLVLNRLLDRRLTSATRQLPYISACGTVTISPQNGRTGIQSP